MADEVEALSQEISDRPLFFRIDVSFGKDLQSQKIGEPEGALLVILVLEALVLFHCSGIGEMDGIAGIE